jgi:hypothetical protein
MDRMQERHARQLEAISRYPDRIGVELNKLDIIAREAWIVKNGIVMAEPDILMLGKEGIAYLVEYKNSFQIKGEAQLDRARQYLKQCQSLQFDKICSIYVIGEDMKLQFKKEYER